MDFTRSRIAVPIIVLILLVVLTGYFVSGADTSLTPVSGTHTIIDLAGRSVEVPDSIERVACLVGPSYEKVFLLGQTSKMVFGGPSSKSFPWAMKVMSPVPQNSVINAQDPNVEELINQKVDAVFFWDYPQPIEKMTEAGLPVVATTVTLMDTGKRPQSIEEFRKFIKSEIEVYGNVLGSDAQKKAKEFEDYYDQKVNYILSRTKDIPENQRPKVYYTRGPGALNTHGTGTNTHWEVEIAGGNFVTKDSNQHIFDASMEEVINWNPDIIIVGRMNSTAAITDDPKWKDISAVKNGKVILAPNGVFYWDYGSEGILFSMWMAKTFYPEKFQDLDMVKEVKEFYQKFYNYALTDDEANRILNHQDPA